MTAISVIIYLLRVLLLGFAIGTVFIRLGLFRKLSDGETMMIGMASTPLFVSLIDYLLGLVFTGWSSWFYLCVPIACAFGVFLGRENRRTAIRACQTVWRYGISFGKGIGAWAICDFCVAAVAVFTYMLLYNRMSPKALLLRAYRSLGVAGPAVAGAMGCICLAAAIFFVWKTVKDGTLKRHLYLTAFLIVIGSAAMHSLLMIGRPVVDSDRAHYELEARYFSATKDSWEIDGYTDEKRGSSLTDDHGPLWVVFLADARIVADSIGARAPLKCENFAIFWVFLCCNALLFLCASYGAGTFRAGVISLLLFHIYVYSILMVFGSRDAFRFSGLMLLALYVMNQIEAISAAKAKWFEYAAMFLFCYLSMNGHEGNVYIMLGMFVTTGIALLAMKTPIRHLVACGASVLLGTLLGITKTISIYRDTGRLTSSTILPFHDTPVVQQITQVNEIRADKAAVWASYSNDVRCMMLIGMVGLAVMMFVAWRKKARRECIVAVVLSGMLLPMTGIMDWIGYEVSLWFAEQIRYRMYFLMVLSVTGSWLLTQKSEIKLLRGVSAIISISVLSLFLRAEVTRCKTYSRSYVSSCISIRQDYEGIADRVSSATNADAFTADQVLLYYLHGTPRLLYHVYTEDLIQAKTEQEIEAALDTLNVGAILLPADGQSYHDYSLLPFWDYIQNKDRFGRITPADRGDSVDMVIYYRKK